MLAVEADNEEKAGIKADDIGSSIDESSTALFVPHVFAPRSGDLQ